MKKQHSNKLAVALSNSKDPQKDSIIKELLQCNIVLAWLLKECVPEFKNTAASDIAEYLSKSNPRSQMKNTHKDSQPLMPVIGSEDNSITNGKIFYDFRTELLLPEAPQDAPFLIFNVEIQKNYGNRMVFHKRVIYYPCRLVNSQIGDLMGGKVDYRRLCRVLSIWALPNAPKKMANKIRRFHWTEDEMSGSRAKRIPEVVPADLMESWVFFLRDGIEPPHEQDARWFLYVLLTCKMTYEERMKILEKDFGITAKDKEEIQKVCWLNDLIRKNSEKIGEERGIKIGEERGERRGEKRGERRRRDKTLLQMYTNMKNANYTDKFICSILGISESKLRKIKRMSVAGKAQTVITV